jgi:hypothetical protein
MFFLCSLKVYQWVIHEVDKFRRHCLWRDKDLQKKNPPLAAWDLVCRPKDQGGLGIEILEIKNKWLFKLLNEDGVWQELVHSKYLIQKTLLGVQAKPTHSPFWKGLMG